MPAITSGKVLVTGSNGYVGAWAVHDLLESGFSVRASVRAESKAAHLREHFKVYGDKLEFVIVADITKDGAFDEATADIDAIMHIASPVPINDSPDPDELIIPAVKGTTSVLTSASKHSRIQRVLVMSSTAALFAPIPGRTTTTVVDESNWNEISVPHVREKGKAADGMHVYRASKVLAERAAWDFWNERKSKGEVGWDLVVFNAPFIYGPVVHEARALDSFGSTQSMFYKAVVEGARKGDALTKAGFEWVDVRDVARAHTLALTIPEAGGERFVVRGGRAVWQDFVNTARRLSDKIPVGEPDSDPDDGFYPATYNADKSIRILGIKYRTTDELTKDSLEDFKARGWF